MTKIDLSRSADYRNVTDYFKGKPDDQIKEELAETRGDMISIMQNLSHDFNKSSAVRNSNAFGMRKLIFLNPENPALPDAKEGIKKWDRRGALGTQNYETIEHYRVTDYQDVFDQLHAEGYTIFAVDNTPGYDPQSLYEVSLPQKSAFLFGEEQLGLADDLIEASDAMIYIPQYGSIRSINVSVANGVIAAFYASQHMPTH
ncbi:TrmH family RNA methyltransferase [Weissella tructae]|uniref:RNA methyltransferase, TrmH family n=2 Tax=Weissella TaxID=46255 RepID=A0A075U0C0_9LACO|nr:MULTISPECIES: TrmH family RNA methyltransferase [Weissella]AIG65985.1 RNA methyltransferase, TrmH family [Weissella tructae]AIM63365.1 RNA methyltransferase, TrmH family [Weissella ceti]AIM64699.1 RNA methyltransferase, TrmH family [Weissella ceti]ELA07356.1 tRNA/rRNA methyltransferase SpoU [Weissella ceti NC36]QVV91140.1 TrmH family RNA methyltransferase [Weissella tructae]